MSLITPGTNQWFKVLRNHFFFLVKAPKTSQHKQDRSPCFSPSHHRIINASGFRTSVLIRKMAPAATLTISSNGLMQSPSSRLQRTPNEEKHSKATDTLRPGLWYPMAGAWGFTPTAFPLTSSLHRGEGQTKQGEETQRLPERTSGDNLDKRPSLLPQAWKQPTKTFCFSHLSPPYPNTSYFISG